MLLEATDLSRARKSSASFSFSSARVAESDAVANLEVERVSMSRFCCCSTSKFKSFNILARIKAWLTLDVARTSNEESLIDEWKRVISERIDDVAENEDVAYRSSRVVP